MSAQPAEEPRGLVPRSELYRALARIDDLKAELDEQRDRMGRWIGEEARLSLMASGFKRYAAVLLAALLARGHQPMDALSFALTPHVRDDDVNADNVLKVRVCCTRKDIRRMGGPETIMSHWGTGYSLSPEGRAWLQKIISEAKR